MRIIHVYSLLITIVVLPLNMAGDGPLSFSVTSSLHSVKKKAASNKRSRKGPTRVDSSENSADQTPSTSKAAGLIAPSSTLVGDNSAPVDSSKDYGAPIEKSNEISTSSGKGDDDDSPPPSGSGDAFQSPKLSQYTTPIDMTVSATNNSGDSLFATGNSFSAQATHAKLPDGTVNNSTYTGDSVEAVMSITEKTDLFADNVAFLYSELTLLSLQGTRISASIELLIAYATLSDLIANQTRGIADHETRTAANIQTVMAAVTTQLTGDIEQNQQTTRSRNRWNSSGEDSGSINAPYPASPVSTTPSNETVSLLQSVIGRALTNLSESIHAKVSAARHAHRASRVLLQRIHDRSDSSGDSSSSSSDSSSRSGESHLVKKKTTRVNVNVKGLVQMATGFAKKQGYLGSSQKSSAYHAAPSSYSFGHAGCSTCQHGGGYATSSYYGSYYR